jgi:hypothetical protein
MTALGDGRGAVLGFIASGRPSFVRPKATANRALSDRLGRARGRAVVIEKDLGPPGAKR